MRAIMLNVDANGNRVTHVYEREMYVTEIHAAMASTVERDVDVHYALNVLQDTRVRMMLLVQLVKDARDAKGIVKHVVETLPMKREELVLRNPTVKLVTEKVTAKDVTNAT